ncbi:TetR/AcrR family transcriptional regulator [Bailinhaonella thermotolerans]|uniref:TetR/AcrR family transcriptional regulator n=1 Tax=Bailinhaonella thermotolerans TaxID=1070861 RepID=A0A3A4AYK0_9ACTN|nr:TetR/AcrR family transcriptional regulator [Bailinhaonella thermotolerans]RJL30937.1 TetR/AcrR family transcriptional regulator [Bailinhaonella thermotolerans]
MSDVPVPPWRTTPKSGQARKPLSQDVILRAALRILAEEGLEGVSMRRVAQELHTGPASLYAHFANKDELLEMMFDHVLGEVRVPEEGEGDWTAKLKAIAWEVRRVLISHGDIAQVGLAVVPLGPNGLRLSEAMLGVLREAGIPDQQVAWAADRLSLYITADAFEVSYEARRGRGSPEEIAAYYAGVIQYFRSLPPDRFPHTTALVGPLGQGDDETRFEFGLDLFIRGLSTYIPADGGTS